MRERRHRASCRQGVSLAASVSCRHATSGGASGLIRPAIDGGIDGALDGAAWPVMGRSSTAIDDGRHAPLIDSLPD